MDGGIKGTDTSVTQSLRSLLRAQPNSRFRERAVTQQDVIPLPVSNMRYEHGFSDSETRRGDES